MKRTAIVLIILVVLAAIVVLGFVFERYVNWELGYKDRVEERVAPLEQKVRDLEDRIQKLERSR